LSTGRTLAAYGHYGLVLLDLTLPDAWPDQSFEAVREFKALGLRVAIVTGSHLTGDLLKQANISGADALVAKDCRTFEQCLVDVVDGRPVEKGC
jgi:CheY-like chemotaxis protein